MLPGALLEYAFWHGLLSFSASWALLHRSSAAAKAIIFNKIAISVICATAIRFLSPLLYPELAARAGVLSFSKALLLAMLSLLLYNAIPWYYRIRRIDVAAIEANFIGKFKPRVYFSATTHARFSPVKHKFRYPLMYVGFPIAFEGTCNALISVRGVPGNDPRKRFWGKGTQLWSFFDVRPENYVNPHLPFSQKLDPVLLQEGIDKEKYPHIYFVTTPRFFGYSFNPVSYWYLYDAAHELKIIFLEVNNTFGEKHMYVLYRDNVNNPKPRKDYLFAGSMAKMFHISPFNHRSGSYVIQVADPLSQNENGEVWLKIHMAVFARDGSKTMAAGAYSVEPALDVLRASMAQMLYTELCWGYKHWMAVPWTMLEAWLVYRKGSVVYTRPEVLKGSGQRTPTRAEGEMQEMWIEYFKDRVQKYPHPLICTLILPESHATRTAESLVLQSKVTESSTDHRRTQSNRDANGESTDEHAGTRNYLSPPPFGHRGTLPSIRTLAIQVNNPRFFRRFFSHQNPAHTVHLEIVSQPYERQAAHINDIGLFLDVLTRSFPSDVAVGHAEPVNQPAYSARWRVVSWLRHLKSKMELEERNRESFGDDVDTTGPGDKNSISQQPPSLALLPHSAVNTLDAYFFSSQDFSSVSFGVAERKVSRYRRKTLQAILTDVIAFGDPEMLQTYESAWAITVWLGDIVAMGYLGTFGVDRLINGQWAQAGWGHVLAILFAVVNSDWLADWVVVAL
ncbi:hypothetical protein BDZ91DRAFT_167116 [Kalaharituber pfeilii]|nr:hypothetical protein BDZ91DRAFT_167116 [Kalaharituber pfeilii]